MTPPVHTYRSGEAGLFVNSYLIEGAGAGVSALAAEPTTDGGVRA